MLEGESVSDGLSVEQVEREGFLKQKARNFLFQPGDFGYPPLGEFEPVGLLTSPYPHIGGYSFFVVYANARHERLLIRHEVARDQSVTEYERFRYAYHGAGAY